MSLYRKKPVVIEATQFTEQTAMAYLFDGAPLPEGLICGSSHIHKERRELYRASFYIETLEGRMRTEYDDWIITGVKGERYPCKPDIFAATYEPAAPGANPVARGGAMSDLAEYMQAIHAVVVKYKGWMEGSVYVVPADAVVELERTCTCVRCGFILSKCRCPSAPRCGNFPEGATDK